MKSGAERAATTTVHLLWHIGHHDRVGDSGTTGCAEGADGEGAGAVHCDEQAGDDPKLLGVYSSADKARDRMRRARPLPGFADEPECFLIDEYTVGADEWPDGFTRVPPPS
ncbi:hypothetical protein ABZ858_27930 [Streptomyces sp. NPDC047017]|uniref:hypothetical protein n=1 Tax=Streptomyces sp. NPDC047017 TaxID=3155024 RepID=UPI0033FD9D5D